MRGMQHAHLQSAALNILSCLQDLHFPRCVALRSLIYFRWLLSGRCLLRFFFVRICCSGSFGNCK